MATGSSYSIGAAVELGGWGSAGSMAGATVAIEGSRSGGGRANGLAGLGAG